MLKIYNTSIFPILMLGCLPSQVPKVTKKLQCGLLIVTFLNGQQMGPWGYVTLGSGPSAEKAELHAISNFPKWAGAEEVPGGGGGDDLQGCYFYTNWTENGTARCQNAGGIEWRVRRTRSSHSVYAI